MTEEMRKTQPKHSAFDLKQMQSLSLDAKIHMTKRRIEEWHDYWSENGDGCYVSFSGGKDSTVLKHLVDSMYNDVPSVFVDTGLEYPEIRKFVQEIKDGKHDKFNSDVVVLRPEMRFDEVVKEVGYPVISKEVAQIVSGARTYLEDLAANRGGQTQSPLNESPKRERERERVKDLLDIPTTIEGLKDWENMPKCVLKIMGMKGRDNQPILRTAPKNERSDYNCERYAYLLDAPFKISSKCCDIMKKKPAKQYEKETGKTPFIGTMASESVVRRQAWQRTGCNAFNANRPHSTPLSFWTEQDILEYIVYYNIPISKAYGEIIKGDNGKWKTTKCQRTGCIFCMLGAHLEKPPKFEQLKTSHPKQYEYCMKSIEEGGLGLRDVIDWINNNSDGKTKIKY